MLSYQPRHAAAVWAAELEAIRRTDWRVVDRFGLCVERLARDILIARGHVVIPGAYADHHDLLANGARVEVEAARWGVHGAYRFNMRCSAAELYLLACCSEVEVLAWFCVPASAVNGQRIIGIWAADPRHHRGQWAAYLEAWEVADRVIQAGGLPAPACALHAGRQAGSWPMQPALL